MSVDRFKPGDYVRIVSTDLDAMRNARGQITEGRRWRTFADRAGVATNEYTYLLTVEGFAPPDGMRSWCAQESCLAPWYDGWQLTTWEQFASIVNWKPKTLLRK